MIASMQPVFIGEYQRWGVGLLLMEGLLPSVWDWGITVGRAPGQGKFMPVLYADNVNPATVYLARQRPLRRVF